MNKNTLCNWGKAAGIRALKTFGQTAVATIGTSAAIDQINFKTVLLTSFLAAILSLFTSMAGLPECEEQGEK